MSNTTTMIEVTCAIIMRDDRVLITQRSERMPHPLKWEFPGGKLLPGESPVGCIVREIREELQVTVEVEQLLPSVIYNYGYAVVKLIPFICSMGSDPIRLKQHRDYRWILRGELAGFDLLEADLQIVERMNGKW
jgi:8-oxo-dGTP diphosphatase